MRSWGRLILPSAFLARHMDLAGAESARAAREVVPVHQMTARAPVSRVRVVRLIFGHVRPIHLVWSCSLPWLC